jgi:lysine 2,3-aminomutase
MPVNNHTVLLKGVNDSLETMRSLMRALLRIKVRPYYLFHCDPVMSAGHFRTSVWKGLEIMEGLRGHMSGLGIPTYVVDSPHGGGKIPLMPNYLVSASNDAVVLRNYEGMLIRYQAEDKPATVQPTKTRGVSSLLQGTKTALVPENTERMQRRRLIVLSQMNGSHGPAEGNGCGGPGQVHRADEGHALAEGNGFHAAPTEATAPFETLEDKALYRDEVTVG